ncbi:MAG TPA: hypothetical protein DCM28_22830 [Phycisphaerales bacterium]|nr:hypothetical protein [Phycisphaerales bacterium]|tara:strand:- start:206762 stop:211906 length:5145 start_codon:yes stop_codon:yes gene_type:complete
MMRIQTQIKSLLLVLAIAIVWVTPIDAAPSLFSVNPLKAIEQFIENAPRVEGQPSTPFPKNPTVLVAPFELSSRWYRNKSTSINLADLLMVQLNDMPDIRLVDRQQLNKSVEELATSLVMDAGQIMRLSSVLKADIALRCVVIQDIKTLKTSLKMQAIDIRHASILAAQSFDLQANAEGFFNPTESDMAQLTRAARPLIQQAITIRRQLANKTILAPLFFCDMSDNDVLSQYQTRFGEFATQAGKQLTNVRILKIAGMDYAATEQVLSLSGLGNADPNAWQSVADQYLWGYYTQLPHPDNTPINDIPVSLKLYCWDGLNAPREYHQQTTVSQFVPAIQRLCEQVCKQIPAQKNLQRCEGLNRQIARHLVSEASKTRRREKAGHSSIRIKTYYRFLRELAAFFDPEDDRLASNNIVSETYKTAHSLRSVFFTKLEEINRWQQFFQHYPNATAKSSYTIKSYVRVLTQAIEYLHMDLHADEYNSDAVLHLNEFPLDMPTYAIGKQMQELAQRCIELGDLFNRTKLSEAPSGLKAYQKLAKAIQSIPVQTSLTQRAYEVVTRISKTNPKGQSPKNLSQETKPIPMIAPKLLAQLQQIREGKTTERPAKSVLYDARIVPPHPLQLLDVPRINAPMLPTSQLMHIDFQHHSSNNLPLSHAIRLTCDLDEIWNYGYFGEHSYNAASQKIRNGFELFRNKTKHCAVTQDGKLYLSVKRKGIAVINLTDEHIQLWTVDDGLLWDSPNQLVIVDKKLYVTFKDHRMNMIDLKTNQITERQLECPANSTIKPTGNHLIAFGSWLLVDKTFLFNTQTGKTQRLGHVLSQLLAGKHHTTIANDIPVQRTAVQGDTLWLTTDTQLIRLNLAKNQCDAWELPFAQPDHLAATARTVYLAYCESTWLNSHHTQVNMHNPDLNMPTHLLAWDINKQALQGRMILPGNMQALAVDYGMLWTFIDRADQRQLLQIITNDPQASRPIALPAEALDQTHLTESNLSRLAYAGQIEPIFVWLASHQTPTLSNARNILTASCYRAPGDSILKLAQAFITADENDNLILLRDPILKSLALGRLDLFDDLLALITLYPADLYSPELTIFSKQLQSLTFKKRELWERQAGLISAIQNRALEYGHLGIYQRYQTYHLPTKSRSPGIWNLPSIRHLHWQTLRTPLAMSIKLDNRIMFDALIANGPIVNNANQPDRAPIPAALENHDGYYLQELLEHGFFIPPLYLKPGQLVHPKRFEQLMQWSTQLDASQRLRLFLPIALELEDLKAVDQLLELIDDPNAPELVRQFIDTSNKQLLELLKAKGWDVATHTPLSCLGKNGTTSINTLDWLIQNGWDLKQTNDLGQTALMCAAKAHQAMNCYVLLEAGADVLQEDPQGRTAKQYANGKNTQNVIAAFPPAKQNQPNPSNTPPRPQKLDDSELDQMLTKAVMENDRASAMLYLAWGGRVWIPFKNYNGHENLQLSPLMYACSRGDTELARTLIVQGHDRVDQRNTEHWTPLMFASAHGHSDLVSLLLEFNADWRLVNDQQMTALELARMYGHANVQAVFEKRGLIKKDARELMRVLRLNDWEQFRKMVTDDGYDINAEDHLGRTVLYLVLNLINQSPPSIHYPRYYNPYSSKVQQLLDMGADPNHQDRFGKTVLHHLLDAYRIDWVPNEHRTTQFFEHKVQSISTIVELLMSNGARVNITDNLQFTPLMLARQNIRYKKLREEIIPLLTKQWKH